MPQPFSDGDLGPDLKVVWFGYLSHTFRFMGLEDFNPLTAVVSSRQLRMLSEVIKGANCTSRLSPQRPKTRGSHLSNTNLSITTAAAPSEVPSSL